MQISTAWSYQSAVSTMLAQQTNLNQTQMEISSGKKYLTPSANPVAASSLIDLNQNIQESQQYQTNIGVAQEKLQLESSTLTSATDVLQSVRELTVQGLNGSNTAANRKQIATQINQLNEQLKTLANTQDADGQYIFSGAATNLPPYTETTATVGGVTTTTWAYQGNTQSDAVTIGPQNRQVTSGDPGSSVFGAIAAPPLTEGSINNIFQALTQLTSDLNNNIPNSASLTDIDTALNNIDNIQASVGSKLNVLTSQQSINATSILDNQTTSSSIGDLDIPSAVSQLALQQTSLQAAQQAFVKVGGMSIFQYM